MSNLLQDLLYSSRNLRKNPMFTCVALLSLALGIGCNTAIFSLMDQVLLRSLPVQRPEELVLLTNPGPHQGHVNSQYSGPLSFSYPMYRDIRDRNPVFGGVLGRLRLRLSLTWQGQTERARGELVTGNYFEVLGVRTTIGRPFSASDDVVPGGHPVVVLSHAYWVRRFAASPGVLNQTVSLNGHPMTVIGVTNPGFEGVGVGDPTDIFVPMTMKAQMTPGVDDLEDRRSIWMNVVARRKPGISVAQAEAAMNTFWRPILETELKQMRVTSQRFRSQFLNKHMTLLPGRKGLSGLRDGFSTPLLVLMGMVGLVLLIACANVANLLIARGVARQREIAIRFALGAGRGRMIRQLLTESLLLALGGGALGILVAAWTGGALLSFLPTDTGTSSLTANPDLRVLCFTAALSMATGLIFGLVPALQATRGGLSTTLKEQAGSVSLGTGQVRFRKVLVVAQIALSLVLLIGAGLFARSLLNLRHVDTGFRADHLMTFTVDPSLNGYQQARILSFFERLRSEIGVLPGVRSVSMATVGLLTDDDMSSNVNVEGYREKDGEDMSPHRAEVGAGYFTTLGIPVIAGRDISSADIGSSHKVAVVNQSMARYFFGALNPLGRHFGFGSGSKSKPDIEIVGVVKDGKYARLREDTPRFVFTPYSQVKNIGQMTFFVRTSQSPASLGVSLREAVQRLDSNLPVSDMKTMEEQVDDSMTIERIIAILSVFFGLLATLLAAVGLYGVMAYTVARRTREIGIRIALGADRANVVKLVMSDVVALSAIGIAIAVGVSLPLGRLVESQLFGLTGRDPVVICVATIVLAGTALLSGYIPALRATRVDPMVALRWD